MLLIFLITYNYEQFFQSNATINLSYATHERVNAVILSIILAVGIILFYFKNGFNFDLEAKNLKLLAKIWITLNVLLIISTMAKNSEYILNFGLTYRRLGVYGFLILAIIGLLFTFLKINNKKTNAYLINNMLWCFYGTILLCSFINWGNLITNYNISVDKGVESHFLRRLNFNDETCQKYFSTKPKESEQFDYIGKNIEYEQSKNFLSKALYYENLSH